MLTHTLESVKVNNYLLTFTLKSVKVNKYDDFYTKKCKNTHFGQKSKELSNHFYLRMVQNGQDGPKRVPNVQKHQD